MAWDGKTIALLVVLALAAAGSTWLLVSSTPSRPAVSGGPHIDRGYYLVNARMTDTGVDGNPLDILTSTMATQSLEDGTVNMNPVRIDYYPPGKVPWTLTSRTGTIPGDASIIHLVGDVVAMSQEATGPHTIIRTDHLDFDPDTSVATTDAQVSANYFGSVLNGLGMRADLGEGRIRLISNVTGQYKQ